MKNPKCGECSKEITIFGFFKHLNVTHIVCPSCMHKNKIKLSFNLTFFILGLISGISITHFSGTSAIISFFFSILIFVPALRGAWPICLDLSYNK